jgi:Mrp family chromosome partitioning ATPase
MAIQRVILTDSRKEDVFYEEAIKTLRTNMQFSGVETKSIVLTSCYPNEGKSDVAFQLAVEIGKMGKRVLIIDADIRKSSYQTLPDQTEDQWTVTVFKWTGCFGRNNLFYQLP